MLIAAVTEYMWFLSVVLKTDSAEMNTEAKKRLGGVAFYIPIKRMEQRLQMKPQPKK